MKEEKTKPKVKPIVLVCGAIVSCMSLAGTIYLFEGKYKTLPLTISVCIFLEGACIFLLFLSKKKSYAFLLIYIVVAGFRLFVNMNSFDTWVNTKAKSEYQAVIQKIQDAIVQEKKSQVKAKSKKFDIEIEKIKSDIRYNSRQAAKPGSNIEYWQNITIRRERDLEKEEQKKAAAIKAIENKFDLELKKPLYGDELTTAARSYGIPFDSSKAVRYSESTINDEVLFDKIISWGPAIFLEGLIFGLFLWGLPGREESQKDEKNLNLDFKVKKKILKNLNGDLLSQILEDKSQMRSLINVCKHVISGNYSNAVQKKYKPLFKALQQEVKNAKKKMDIL